MQRENSIIFRLFSQRSNIEKEALRPAALSNVRAQQKKQGEEMESCIHSHPHT